jgi:GT2 family glycosyltransferase
VKTPKVEICIPTRNRIEQLGILLSSLASQTYKNFDILIVDDSDKQINFTHVPFISPTLNLLTNNGNNWRVLFGCKKGPHHSHKLILKEAKSNYIFRVDDDCVLEPTCLERLVETITEDDSCAGVAPLVLNPNIPSDKQTLPDNWRQLPYYDTKVTYDDKTKHVNHSPGIQWHFHLDEKPKLVEHLHSSFIYKKAVAVAVGGWDEMIDELSSKGMTEETWFSYKLFKAGFKLYVDPRAIAWHYQAPNGGVRTENNDPKDAERLYWGDREKFSRWFKRMGYDKQAN